MSQDPAQHRELERQFISHIEKLLADPRLRVDTTQGLRPITSFVHSTSRNDQTVDLKRAMTEANRPDRELQNKMPQGESLEVTLQRRTFLGLFRSTVGKVKAIAVSPTRDLLVSKDPSPIGAQQLRKIIDQTGASEKVPTTMVVLSTSGFSLDAHELTERRSDRMLILVEPNGAGGWNVTGPVETKAIVDLFDPEAEAEKRDRIFKLIDEQSADLSGAGIASDKISARLQLPVSLVEAELKAYTKSRPGLTAKRLDGRVVLFREGHAPAGSSTMPLIDRMKALFSRKGETEKKIALLSERRAALSQQRDRAYEELGTVETRESALKAEFATANSEASKRRITGQILQLRKDLDRRQQLISVLNQQLDVVGTHLHNLQLLQQGQNAKLPDNEEIVEDAGKAEEMLAELQANVEIASGASTTVATGLSSEEQALYDELQGSLRQNESQAAPSDPISTPTTSTPTRTPEKQAEKRAEPEAG